MPERAIPWKLVGASPDMMDTNFGDRRFPFRWRSSIAIYAYEPPLESLPPELCDDRLTLVKVSCSITGYQPTEAETARGYSMRFPNVPTTEIRRLVEQYHACYGALLNVAVFPPADVTDLRNFPHVVDFEPKTRDLYQAATAEGELLSASASEFSVDRSFTNTASTETAIDVKAGLEVGPVKGEAGLSHKRSESRVTSGAEKTHVAAEERRRTAMTTTTNQMYNLLTGYHAGTNRAVFLMQARPHTMATPGRTFVQGARVIEGMQDFVLIVARPRAQDLLRVEAVLETGHLREPSETMLVTTRGLSASMRQEGRCVRPQEVAEWPESIVAEVRVAALQRNAIEQALLSSGRLADRYKPGEIGFLDTDYFAGRIAAKVPTAVLDKTAVAAAAKLEKSLVHALGTGGSLKNVAAMSVSQIARQASITLPEAARVRRTVLGLPPKSEHESEPEE